MTRLLLEASRVKKVLSANQNTVAKIESLLDGVALSVPIARWEFEEVCAGLFERVVAPLEKILANGAVPLANITSVVLVGGGSRIPKIQAMLREFLAKEPAQNINADEAAAFGAGYKAALYASYPSIKRINNRDITAYPIATHILPLAEHQPKERIRRFSHTGLKYHIPFNQTSDFRFLLTEEVDGGPHPFATVAVGGFDAPAYLEAVKHLEEGQHPKTTVFALVDPSGRVVPEKAEAVFPHRQRSLWEVFLSTIGFGSAGAPGASLPLTLVVENRGQSEAQYQEALAKIQRLHETEAQHGERQEAINTLEAFIYSRQSSAEGKNQEAFSKALLDALTWITGVGASASTDAILEKLKVLQTMGLTPPTKETREPEKKEVVPPPAATETIITKEAAQEKPATLGDPKKDPEAPEKEVEGGKHANDHGHSHSHGHSHGEDDHDEDNGHSHSHGHSHGGEDDHDHDHGHSHGHHDDDDHDHGHSHSHGHAHGHEKQPKSKVSKTEKKVKESPGSKKGDGTRKKVEL